MIFIRNLIIYILIKKLRNILLIIITVSIVIILLLLVKFKLKFYKLNILIEYYAKFW
jgi:hypothetical protein